ncbi:MAG: hypothetical protein ATN36_06675 [Epulopiscium sp. Nele67-Bin005]|nr:MAG: hypothetical protein ATN36_06675 [Epulopiscium sp. Nele67-Bin005]
MELVKVHDDATVSGRELHEALEVGTQYTKWFERMTEYGFIENTDFIAISQKRLTAQGNETTYFDHCLTISMAKEIAMLQRSDIGKQVRQYFLQVEKELSELKKDSWEIDDRILRAEKYAKEQRLIKQEQQKLLAEIEINKPKIEHYDAVLDTSSEITISVIAKELGTTAIWLNKFLAKAGVQYKKGNVWALYACYDGKGYVKYRTHISDGKTYHSMVWTEVGREFIHRLVKHQGGGSYA